MVSVDTQHLHRRLTLLPLFFIAIANMVGTGIFTTSGYMMRDLQSPVVMISAWVIGGLIALSGALCYGELGSMFPYAGGDYVFLRESFGKRCAFLSGWISLWVGFSAPIAASAMAFGYYLRLVMPEVLRSAAVTSSLAAGVIVFFMLIHLRGVSFGSGVQTVLSCLKVLFILGFSICGMIWGNGSWSHFSPQPQASDFFTVDFTTALIFVTFAYSGWNASAYLGGEAKNPERNIPSSIVMATLFVIVVYVFLNITYVYAVPPHQMAGVAEIGNLAAVHLYGDMVGGLFAAFIAFCLLSTLGSMMMTGPRVYYAMALDGMFMRFFAATDRKHHIPKRSICLQGVISIVMVLTASFRSLLLYMGFILVIFSSLTVIGLLRLRRTRPDMRRPYRAWGYPVTPLFYILANAWIVVMNVGENIPVLLAAIATVGSGWIFYEFTNKRPLKEHL